MIIVKVNFQYSSAWKEKQNIMHASLYSENVPAVQRKQQKQTFSIQIFCRFESINEHIITFFSMPQGIRGDTLEKSINVSSSNIE